MAKPYEISATIQIDATPAKVHEVLIDLGRLDDWSPYSAMDKSLQSTVSTPSVGEGAVYEYTGKRIGKGKMEIMLVSPDCIKSQMTFYNGKKTDIALTEYCLEPNFEGTKVTWSMKGERGTFGQIMNAVIGLDKMMTKSFNDGLKVLKAIVE
jgi:hypothetical protein